MVTLAKVNPMKKVLIICMGNICRSPTGEAVLKAIAAQKNVAIEVDSAGTIDYHVGDAPDSRAKAAGEKRGYSFAGITSRQVCLEDFAYFDLILAADNDNISELMKICPDEYAHKVKLFLSYSQSAYNEIPDPYYGGNSGFELVLDLIEDASQHLLDKLK